MRDDHAVVILRADEAGELEEVEDIGALAGSKWQSVSLHDDVKDVFRLVSDDAEEEEEVTSILLFGLTTDGGLQVILRRCPSDRARSTRKSLTMCSRSSSCPISKRQSTKPRV